MYLLRVSRIFNGVRRFQRPNRELCLVTSDYGRNCGSLQNCNYVKHFSTSKRDDETLKSKHDEVTTKPANLTQAQKLKKAVAEYGTTVIVFHITISLISLGSCYLLVSSGLDVPQLLIKLKLNEWFKESTMLVSNAGTFAVAYAIHKVFAPVRIGVTLGSVPFIIKYLRNKGILKN